MSFADEEILIARCIAGDRTYQEILYRNYCRKFMGICLRYARSREEAEDVLQEGFYRIFSSLKQYNATGSFEGWMRKIIVNANLEALRKKQLMFAESDLSIADEEPVEENYWDDLHAKELVRLISRLPAGYRVVFNLYAVEGYSHREIAAQLGISEGTSRSQFAKARKQLRQMILKSEQQLLTNVR